MLNFFKVRSFRVLLLALCVSALVTAGSGAAPISALDYKPSRREFKIPPLAFTGEKLTYEVKFSRFPIYATVGEVAFEFLGATPEPLPENLIADLTPAFKASETERFFHLRAVAVAKGFLTRLLGVKAEDRFESLVEQQDFSARLSFKRIQEGKKNLAQTTLFAREKDAAALTIRDVAQAEARLQESTVKAFSGTLDLLSAIYYLRTQKLKSGETFNVPLHDDGVQYDIPVMIGKTEKLKTNLGKFKTILVQPQIFGEGRLITRPGELTLWLTDDERRIPIKAVAQTSSGTVTATLIRIESPRPVQAGKK